MNDKELLELAAKAAGIEVTAYDWQMGCRVVEWGVYKDWNPLTDDGDALRLAVKLGLSLDCYIARACKENKVDVCEDKFKDAEAVRRVIVRAAAEIGREL